MYTATEDRMTVLTVGSCFRQTLNWSVMFLFTLVQSRTHVDTVQSVLRTLANSRHLLKSHNEGTWLTCNICQKFSRSGNLNQHLLRYEGVKPYVCSQCPKCFVQFRTWYFISWYTRTTNSFAVVCAIKILNTKVMLYNISRNVLDENQKYFSYFFCCAEL